MYSKTERIAGAVALAIAVGGQLNAWSLKLGVFGMSAQQLSVALYLPALVIALRMVAKGKPPL